jgi:uncharacterized protein YheU (UPF0270 family)
MESNTIPTTDVDGIIVPYDQITPDTLNLLITDIIAREWSSLSDDGFTLQDKVEQVLAQLIAGKTRMVFDITTETVNLVALDS